MDSALRTPAVARRVMASWASPRDRRHRSSPCAESSLAGSSPRLCYYPLYSSAPVTTILHDKPNAGASEEHDRTRSSSRAAELLKYVAVGALFGIVLVKSEVISWYRIQEMFRFQSFHMYGVLGSGMMTALISLEVLKRAGARTLTGEAISIPAKQIGKGYRYWIGGGIFGVGWALTGACPGPLFALVGTGASIYVAVGLAALLGTWTYGLLRPHLPH